MTTVDVSGLTASLAASVGEPTARAAVTAERERLGFGETLTLEQAGQLLLSIEAKGGAIGLAARLARARLDRTSGAGLTSSSGSIALVLPSFSTAQVTEMFVSALGQEKALEIVKQAMIQQGLSGDRLTFDQVSRLLEALSRQTGVVSTVARFAKARLLLKTGG